MNQRPIESLRTHVDAPSAAVWDALISLQSSLTPSARVMIREASGPVRIPATSGGSGPGAPWVNVEADPERRRLAIAGQWWFRGEYAVSDDGEGSLLEYRSFNVAARDTRWLVPLVAGRALRFSARPSFDALSRAISESLHVIGEPLG